MKIMITIIIIIIVITIIIITVRWALMFDALLV